jgi:hypothetical protein
MDHQMNPTAAQFEEAHRIIYQVGVPTEKVVADVAQLIADLDEWHFKLHATQPKYQPDVQFILEGGDSPARSNSDQLPVMPVPTSNPSAPAAGQPDEVEVEQRLYNLVGEVFDLEVVGDTAKAAQLLANSEADAVDAATKELRAKIELLDMQAAACMTACFQNTEQSSRARIDRSNPYWTQAYDDVCKTVDREMKHRNEAALLQAQLAQAEAAISELKEFVRTITLDLQNHRSLSEDRKDLLFQQAYRLYCKFDVEGRAAMSQQPPAKLAGGTPKSQ